MGILLEIKFCCPIDCCTGKGLSHGLNQNWVYNQLLCLIWALILVKLAALRFYPTHIIPIHLTMVEPPSALLTDLYCNHLLSLPIYTFDNSPLTWITWGGTSLTQLWCIHNWAQTRLGVPLTARQFFLQHFPRQVRVPSDGSSFGVVCSICNAGSSFDVVHSMLNLARPWLLRSLKLNKNKYHYNSNFMILFRHSSWSLELFYMLFFCFWNPFKEM